MWLNIIFVQELIENTERPKFPANRLNFHNCLAAKKYCTMTRDGKTPFDYDKQGHRSSKHEAAFMMSAYMRKDRDLVMRKNH
jgi:hypothetical protein